MMRKFRPKFSAAAVVGCLGSSILLTGCTIGAPTSTDDEESAMGTSTVTITSSATAFDTSNPTRVLESTVEPEPVQTTASATAQPNTDDIASQMQLAVDNAVSVYGGSAGIALSDGYTSVTAGDMTPYASWSTIKVPIAIAALRNDPSQLANVTAAIQWSDNAAAETLWGSLGASEEAGLVTEGVLAEGGVQVPVSTVVTREGFSSFGQTMWAASDQARFAANLACIPGSEPILQNMAQIEPSQSWGIGGLPQAQFKGGWGPEPNGSYSARQFGLTTDPATGQSRALAIIVRSGSGNFNDAQMMANALISEVQSVIPQSPPTSC